MRQVTKPTILIALAVAAICAGVWIAQASDPGPAATYRTRVIDQREEGEVVVNGQVAIRIRSAAGGYSAAERAKRVSERLEEAMAKGLKPSQITAGTANGEAAVLANGLLLMTADRFHAQTNGTAPERLAATWAGNLRRALGGKEPMTEPALGAAAARANSEPIGGSGGQMAANVTASPQHNSPYWSDWSTGAKKYVPIVSVGSPGVAIGAAQVQGPAAQVAKVKAVAELIVTLKGDAFRMKVYVPVDSISLTNFHRVQGCSVAAFVDIRVLKL